MTFINLIPPIYVNVRQFGAVGDGSTDDTAAIQSAINAASSSGATVMFPAGTYKVSATIQLKEDCAYVGSGRKETIIKQANGANLPSVVASYDWYNNSTTCGNPLTVRNLVIDGNSANNTTSWGLTLMNFSSIVEEVCVQNTPSAGIVLTSINQGGTDISNTCVNNKIINCEVVNAGTSGIYCQDGTNRLTDGYILNCIVNTSAHAAINMERAAGWQVRGNHVYGVSYDGIVANNCYGTIIADNYIDGFGQSNSTDLRYGIDATILGNIGSVFSGNTILSDERTSGSHYTYVHIIGADGITLCQVNVYGNIIGGSWTSSPNHAGGDTSYSIGYSFGTTSAQQASGKAYNVYEFLNTADNVGQRLQTGTNVTYKTISVGGPLAFGQSSTAAVIANSSTITTSGIGVARVAPTSNVTGVILQAASTAGHVVTVVNESSHSIVFAASGTGNIAAGAATIIGPFSSQQYVWDTGTSLWYSAQPVPTQSTSATSLSSSGTISTTGLDVSRVTTSGAVTGIILQAGAYNGQRIAVTNESANLITFASSGTSNVAGGTGATISANTSKFFIWTGSLWY